MSTLDIIKRAILEGKLDTELGITDGDVVKRFDIVMKLLDKPIQMPELELPAIKPTDPSPFDWGNKVWCSSNPIVMGKVEEPTDG
jgi:hypothetical protein